jgi:hypothetical protein
MIPGDGPAEGSREWVLEMTRLVAERGDVGPQPRDCGAPGLPKTSEGIHSIMMPWWRWTTSPRRATWTCPTCGQMAEQLPAKEASKTRNKSWQGDILRGE